MLAKTSRFSTSLAKSSVTGQARSLFHSSPKALAESGKAYSVTDHPAEFPVQDFEKYKLDAPEYTRRAYSYFIVGASGMGFATVAKSGVVSALGSLSASSDVLALANVEVDLSTIPEGTTQTVKWRGKPLFVRHRTQEEIDVARSVPVDTLPDPQTDDVRVKQSKPEWLVVLGICTHLGCVPLGYSGDYNGWFCPCHGSHYDTSGRIRKGPAPANLEVPPYSFLSDDKIVVGVEG